MLARHWLQLAVLLIGPLSFGIFIACSKPETTAELTPIGGPPPASNVNGISPVPVIDPGADFSRFQHTNETHARFPCALCHERKDNSPIPKLTGHTSCSGCHTAQFADNKSAICTVCHTNAESGAIKAFPPLKSFNVVFNHARHANQTGCATCHKPSGNGVARSIPSGLNAHNTCFQCHSPGSQSGDRSIDSCSTCHQAGRFGGSISERAAAYEKTPFRHDKHRLDCTACHTIMAGTARGRQVTSTLAVMHFANRGRQSCASCHNNRRAFGGDDFFDCTRCHKTKGTFKFS
jgi:c(7)-type cytochrome triheme protein